ncbi:hypothetical protein [Photobacterium kishitanii]|nr:hypothetical protein [Photobacterium kishitanii]
MRDLAYNDRTRLRRTSIVIKRPDLPLNTLSLAVATIITKGPQANDP